MVYLNLWPNISSLDCLVVETKFDKQKYLEDLISNYLEFKNKVVVFNSGRAAISCLIEHFGLKRENLIRIPRFSSTCLHVSAGRHCSTTDKNIKNDLQIVYKRWGNQIKYKKNNLTLQDCIDSLFTSKTNTLNGEYKLYSFSKLYGSPYGAFLLFQGEDEYKSLTKIRDLRINNSIFQYKLKKEIINKKNINIDAYILYESYCGPLGNTYVDKIIKIFSKHKEIIELRKQRIEDLLEKQIIVNSNFSDIPSCVILNNDYIRKEIIDLLPYLNIEKELDYDSSEMEKVYLLPIHQQINSKTYDFILSTLDK